MSALTLADLRPGDILVTTIGGVIPGLFPVAAGQALLAPSEARRTRKHWWHWRHIAVVVQEVGAGLEYFSGPSAARLVQAMPSGAEEIAMTFGKHWTKECLYIRPAYPEITEWEQCGVADFARRYVGRPYSFADYAAVAAHRLRNGHRYTWIEQRDWLARYVANSKRMICSQLADQALTDAGWHCFNDGRLPQDVLPAELACKLLSMPGQHLRPGDERWSDNTRWPQCCPVDS